MDQESDERSLEAAALNRFLSLQEPGESDATFARRMGIAPQVLSNYKNDHHGLSLKTALRVHASADVSLDWLLAGRGSPVLEESADGGERGDFDAGSRFLYVRLMNLLSDLTATLGRTGALSESEHDRLTKAFDSFLTVAGDGEGGARD